jgi:hypothetical protein
VTAAAERECAICSYPEPCECADWDDWDGCDSCGGSGVYVPGHCCLCGGSPYCNCCRTCGKCVGECGCPVKVILEDGTERTL